MAVATVGEALGIIPLVDIDTASAFPIGVWKAFALAITFASFPDPHRKSLGWNANRRMISIL